MTRNEEMLSKFRLHADEVNDRIKNGIEQHRKTYATITVTDKDGAPVKGAKIHIKHKKHDFLFGANLFMLDEMETEEKNAEYKKAFAECFEAATLPFYWSDLEPEEGKPRFSKDSPKVYRRPAPDLCLEYCEANNITPKAHCLTYVNFNPPWLDESNLGTVRAKLEKRYKELSERYRGRIHGWEVINETLCNSPRRDKCPYFRERGLVEENFRLAENYFRENELIINEATNHIWEWSSFQFDRSAYYTLIERTINRGARIDCIGMQYHAFNRREEEHKFLSSIYDPVQIFRVLDQYSDFNLPIQITEITIPAYSDSEEDMRTQAEILEWLYKIWFSHPAVEGAMYWNLVDGYAAFAPLGDMTAGENYYRGGLIDFNMKKKPAYEALKKLIHEEWTTEQTLTADDGGRVKFKGFFGEYDVEIDGTIYKAKLSKDRSHDIKITLK
ncbi:MAG: endo-1,4-beta-xylanase [Clostridia bacterium]|nr:endo-1,4-beta-xylanase [Clostridia bacterium]